MNVLRGAKNYVTGALGLGSSGETRWLPNPSLFEHALPERLDLSFVQIIKKTEILSLTRNMQRISKVQTTLDDSSLRRARLVQQVHE